MDEHLSTPILSGSEVGLDAAMAASAGEVVEEEGMWWSGREEEEYVEEEGGRRPHLITLDYTNDLVSAEVDYESLQAAIDELSHDGGGGVGSEEEEYVEEEEGQESRGAKTRATIEARGGGGAVSGVRPEGRKVV